MTHCKGCLYTRKRILNWWLMGIFRVEDEISYDLCPVGKFLGERVVKFNAMERTLLALWHSLKGATVKPMGKSENPEEINFSFVDFRVQVHDLPLRLASKGLAKSLGNTMGMFLDYDALGIRQQGQDFLKVTFISVAETLQALGAIRTEAEAMTRRGGMRHHYNTMRIS
ncbi:hypothetical protein Gotur_000232 [Gossypium turneri]